MANSRKRSRPTARKREKAGKLEWLETLIPENNEPLRIVLNVRPPGGVWTRVEISPSTLRRTSKAVDVIADRTKWVHDHKGLQKLIVELTAADPRRDVLLTRRSGRREALFIMPSRVVRLSEGAKRNVRFDPAVASANAALSCVGKRSGTLAGWKRQVASLAGGSSIGITVVAAALAPSLLELSGITEGFLLNIAGRTSGGKSLMSVVAMSVQGEADRLSFIPPGLSERALTDTGVGLNELLVVFDDLSNLDDPKKIRRIARWLTYQFSAGGRRLVGEVALQNYPSEAFRSIGLFSYEYNSTAIAQMAGAQRQPGESVRVFDLITAPVVGVFDRVPVTKRPGLPKMAESLEEAVKRHYGLALPAFLKWLAGVERDELKARLKDLMHEFTTAVAPEGDTIQRRAAQKFGLLYAALVLAKSARVVPWSKAKSFDAVSRCYTGAMSQNAHRATGTELVARLRASLREPGAVLDLAAAKEHTRTMSDGWIAVRGLSHLGVQVLGLERGALIRMLDGPGDFDRLMEELEAGGYLAPGADARSWLARLPYSPGGQQRKKRLIRCDLRLAE